MRRRRALRIGLISDTHGLLRPEALAWLAGSDRIVHAGDIGKPEILQQLAGIAPVVAVRGNNDEGAWAESLDATRVERFGDIDILVIHDLAELDVDPRAAGVRAVVSGHSHAPKVHERDGVLYVNPGSAGPRRFKLPISLGELLIEGSSITANLHTEWQ